MYSRQPVALGAKAGQGFVGQTAHIGGWINEHAACRIDGLLAAFVGGRADEEPVGRPESHARLGIGAVGEQLFKLLRSTGSRSQIARLLAATGR